MMLVRPSILVTDDDPVARQTFRDIFEPEGYHTLLAESGEEAIDIVNKGEDVHVAVMDMHLPRMTGLETYQILRQIRGLIPMILVSAESNDDLLRKALSAKAFCVLAKPVSKNVVIYMVTRALRKFY
jgi:CheY-like chemotaxis protein